MTKIERLKLYLTIIDKLKKYNQKDVFICNIIDRYQLLPQKWTIKKDLPEMFARYDESDLYKDEINWDPGDWGIKHFAWWYDDPTKTACNVRIRFLKKCIKDIDPKYKF